MLMLYVKGLVDYSPLAMLVIELGARLGSQLVDAERGAQTGKGAPQKSCSRHKCSWSLTPSSGSPEPRVSNHVRKPLGDFSFTWLPSGGEKSTFRSSNN